MCVHLMSPSPFFNLMICTCVSMLFNLFVFVMTTVCWVCVYVWLPRKPSVGVTFHITFLHLISSFRLALHPTWTMKCGNCLYQDSHLVPGTALYSCIWACMNTRRHTDTYLHTHVCALTHTHTHTDLNWQVWLEKEGTLLPPYLSSVKLACSLPCRVPQKQHSSWRLWPCHPFLLPTTNTVCVAQSAHQVPAACGRLWRGGR